MNNTETSRVKVNQDVNGLNNFKKKSSIESLQKYTMQESKKTKTNHDCALISFI